jgi:hypothetical protein
MAISERELKCGLSARQRTVILMLDEVIVTETPPLYSRYGQIGRQVSIPITGSRAKRILQGVINVCSRAVLPLITDLWNDHTHQFFLGMVRAGESFCLKIVTLLIPLRRALKRRPTSGSSCISCHARRRNSMQRILQALSLKEYQVGGEGHNSAFVLASVWLYQICYRTNYREGKPLACIKNHLDCARWRIPSG